MTNKKITVAVCENPPELVADSADWSALCGLVKVLAPQLFLMNELPFGSWISAGKKFLAASWEKSRSLHETGVKRLAELGAETVALTVPRVVRRQRVNEASTWTARLGLRPVHTKQFFPEEQGFYEARWFRNGPRHFRIAKAGGLRCGFLICTELMFNELARRYGRSGAQVILVPRATGESLERWLVATRMAAIVSGCYVCSSNRAGCDSRGQKFGGEGWIVDPKGELVARTSSYRPVASCEIDLNIVNAAQKEYPCYVKE